MNATRRRACLDQMTPYVPGKPIEAVKRELGIKDVIKMASNENPLGPSPRVLEAVREFLPLINFYPDADCHSLKEDLAKHFALESKNIIVGNGADELIFFVGTTYLDPGDEMIVACPSFSEYESAAQQMNALPVRVPCRDFDYDLEAMAAAVNKKTKLIVICNPNNPTGKIVTHGELEAFLKKLPADVLVIIDEAYKEYVTDSSYPRSLEFLKNGHNVLILRTFSKGYGLAGLRVGYGLAPAAVIADLNIVRPPFNVNSVAQVAARAALGDQEHLQAVQALNNRGKEFLSREFERLGLFYLPTETNFFFVEVGVDSRQLFKKLLQKGVIVRSGSAYGFPYFIRVSIATEEQNTRFIEALEGSLEELRSI
ncbi:MAG: histidinol-phosphate transaminase [Firmicutes bacterium]|nr:histidinol-phosphate transaminase [Bacillota bacterium]